MVFGSICKTTFYKFNLHNNRGESDENKVITLFLLTFVGGSAIMVDILGGAHYEGKESIYMIRSFSSYPP